MDYVYPGLFATAILVGLILGERLYEEDSRNEFRILYLCGVLGGLAGGRIWYEAQYAAGNLRGGFSIYGFFMGAVAAVLLANRIRTGCWINSHFTIAVTPAIPIGIAIQRVGCFISGCCYGKPTALPWGVTYGVGSPAYDHQVQEGLISPAAVSTLPIHPTQLYQSLVALFWFVILLLLFYRSRIRLRSYEPLLATGVFFSVFRFFMELLRDDSGGIHFGSLTFAQVTSLAIFIACSVLLVVLRKLLK